MVIVVSVLTLATDMPSSSSAAIGLGCQLFLLVVIKTFFLVNSDHFYLDVREQVCEVHHEESGLSTLSQQEFA